MLKEGDTSTVGISVSEVKDLFSLPLMLKFDPSVIQIEKVLEGDFFSGGGQPIAFVQLIDMRKGEVMISATRPPRATGVSGSGTVFGLQVRGLHSGMSKIKIVELHARDSNQQSLSLEAGDTTVTAQP